MSKLRQFKKSLRKSARRFDARFTLRCMVEAYPLLEKQQLLTLLFQVYPGYSVFKDELSDLYDKINDSN